MTEKLPEETQPEVRAPYVAPVLEELGSWSALTLQQSFPLTDPVYGSEY
ncbi:MAG: hypothetical protein ICV87_00560 [Gemmatimonadetes bacterium]|nr:hypothetical protein [Gemmatimonadota bacterium]